MDGITFSYFSLPVTVQGALFLTFDKHYKKKIFKNKGCVNFVLFEEVSEFVSVLKAHTKKYGMNHRNNKENWKVLIEAALFMSVKKGYNQNPARSDGTVIVK